MRKLLLLAAGPPALATRSTSGVGRRAKGLPVIATSRTAAGGDGA